MQGVTLCFSHGGSAPQIQRKKREREALTRAQQMVEAAGVDMEPVEHLLDSLYRAHGLMLAYGVLVSELNDHELTATTKLGERKMHPYVVHHEQAIERRARLAKLCVDAKVGERQMQLAEHMGRQLSMMFEKVIAAIPDLTEPQRLVAAEALVREAAQLEAAA